MKSPAVWRTCAILFIACAVAFVCYQMTIPQQDDYGIEYVVARNEPGSIRVTSVHPGSSAAQAGVRAGDIISYGNTVFDQARVLYAHPGERVAVTRNHSRAVTLTARYRARGGAFISTLIRLLFLSIAALLAWRRPDDRATRVLVVFLACYGLAIAMDNGVLASPLLSLIVLQVLNSVLFVVGTAAAARFAAIFPSGHAKPVPGTLSRIAITLSVLTAVAGVAAPLLARNSNSASISGAAVMGVFALIASLVVVTLVVAYVQGDPNERQRRKWVFLALGIGLSGPIIDLAVQSTIGLNRLVDEFSLLPMAALPIVLAYAILRHRVIDVGFVLSRAVVYTAVSVIIVGIFVVVETLVAKYVEQVSHVESLVVQLVVALVLGFSIRAIHARVDAFVDSILFRERRAALKALEAFATDAPFMTDASLMLARAIGVIEREAGARGAGIWLRADLQYEPAAATFANAGPVDENDAAIVAMRARRVTVNLPLPDSTLPGVLALPMAVHGELVGALVCGAKGADETYDPDERQALAALASAVAHGLDAIELRELRAAMARLGATREAPAAF